ncbi:MAG: TolC family protein [Chitinophagaceae bacterium]
MKRLVLLVVGFSGFMTNCFAQRTKPEVFTLDAFIGQVRKYHPIAKQADLQVDKAGAELIAARGNFDPFLGFEASDKTFDGKNYYFYNNPELTVPLPVGNLRAGFENNGGDFPSPETTKGKTSYLGIELPLAKGLLMDKRRAVLQQAKIYSKQSVQERLIILNNLLFEAYNAYWQWAASYRLYLLYSEFVAIAEKRLWLVRIAFKSGDRAIMDTTEAFVQFQNYQLSQSEALLKWNNASLELSNYLWKENEDSYLVSENQLPEYFPDVSDVQDKDAGELIRQSSLQNPTLKLYDYKLNSLEVERKLKIQNLLPYFSVKANLLNKDYNILKNVNPAFIQNNYKWGIEFKIPLFLREARGDYRKTKLKIKETNLELLYKRQETENKIRGYLNKFNMLRQQITTSQSLYNNYKTLLSNEELKFAQGESSLFFVNGRENKLIELAQKQVELTLKYYKAKYAIEWATGIIYLR